MLNSTAGHVTLRLTVFEIFAVKWQNWCIIRQKWSTRASFLIPHLVTPKDIATKRSEDRSGTALPSCKLSRRSVSGMRRSEHITPVVEDLHWLPVSQRVVFKTALMVWKCVHGIAPAYLSDLCVSATANSGRQHLRSAAPGALLVSRARTATGQRSFAVNGPATWNRLPPALRSPYLSESAFKRALKTHLFSTARRH